MKIRLVFLLLFITFSVFGQTVPSYIPTNGLIGWWPFNGNANDESGNGHSGVLFGNPVTVADRCGNVNSAYEFQCYDYIRVPHDSDFIFSSHTISFWLYFNFSCLSSTDISLAIRKGISWDSTSIYTLFKMNGGLLRTHLGGSFTNYGFLPYWSLISMVYDSSTSTGLVYIDDSLVSTVNPRLFSLTNDSAIYFCFNQSGISGDPSYGIAAKMDDIGIWNRALTASEISAIFNSCTTDIDERSFLDHIKFYPNPASHKITIDCDSHYPILQNYELRITNMLGQQVFSSPINQQQFYLDVSNWMGRGTFFGYVYGMDGALHDVRKIIIE